MKYILIPWATTTLVTAVVVQGLQGRGRDPPTRHAGQGLHHHHHGHRGAMPQEIQQEIERMAFRADRLARTDQMAAAEVDGGLEDMEAMLAKRADVDMGLAAEIRSERGALCSKQGFRSHERADCEAFMRKSCIPDQAQSTGSAVAVPLLPQELCRHFFLEDMSAAREGSASPAPVAIQAPSPSVMQAPGPAPAPMGMQSPSPAKASSPWFSKLERSLPEQGYSGDLVDHDDAETQTADWQQEFGPNSGHRSLREICRDHPNNRWCYMHMNYDGPDAPSGWGRSGGASGGASGSRWSGLSSDRDGGMERDGAAVFSGVKLLMGTLLLVILQPLRV